MTLTYYARHGAFTEVNDHGALFETLTSDVAGLCRVIQGLLIHDHSGLHYYGDPPESFHLASRETVPVGRRTAEIVAAHGERALDARPLFERTVGTCRDFALMRCAILRHDGVAARVRWGFAAYFDHQSFEDHWVCEYWNAHDRRWALADAQLDDAHKTHLSIDFDTADIPRNCFICAW